MIHRGGKFGTSQESRQFIRGEGETVHKKEEEMHRPSQTMPSDLHSPCCVWVIGNSPLVRGVGTPLAPPPAWHTGWSLSIRDQLQRWRGFIWFSALCTAYTFHDILKMTWLSKPKGG